MIPPKTYRSIRELPPLEVGGVIARQGFSYQDHVAVSLVLDLLTTTELSEVWCESQDDVTLLWARESGEEVEFVQVKASELDQLWTAALICKHDGSAGRSLVEKSLANDRCNEPTSFRLITRWQVKAELDVLMYPFEDSARTAAANATLAHLLIGKLGDLKSEKANGIVYWVERTIWIVKGDQQAVSQDNLLRINALAYDFGFQVAPDQLEAIYGDLLGLVRAAAEAPPGNAKQRITRDSFRAHLMDAVRRHSLGPEARPGLGGKLKEAGFPQSVVVNAVDLRMKYRQEVLTPKYFTSEDRDRFETEVQAALHELQVGFDGGQFTETPTQFLIRCLHEIEALRHAWGARGPSRSIVQGMMYDLTHRCLHRFHKVSA